MLLWTLDQGQRGVEMSTCNLRSDGGPEDRSLRQLDAARTTLGEVDRRQC